MNTPKTLQEAIQNGYNEWCNISDSHDLAAITLVHVRDYLAQKFTAAMVDAPDVESERILEDLYKDIIT